MNVLGVFFIALLTDLATGLGAVPFFFVRNLSRRIIGISEALAGGLMVGASYNLIFEGLHLSQWGTIAGIVLGMIFIILSEKFFHEDKEYMLGSLRGKSANKAIIFLIIMTMHSFAEGIGVGVSFGGGENLGILTSLAIAVHNIPEGLAISLFLIAQGASAWEAMFWSIFSSLPQPLMAVPAYIAVEIFKPFLPVGFGFAAGAMIYLVFSELVPSSLEKIEGETMSVSLMMGLLFMIVFSILL